jgi:hypothetical protein
VGLQNVVSKGSARKEEEAVPVEAAEEEAVLPTLPPLAREKAGTPGAVITAAVPGEAPADRQQNMTVSQIGGRASKKSGLYTWLLVLACGRGWWNGGPYIAL